jgi:hypothetical protein
LLADDLQSLIHGVYDKKGMEVKPGIIPTAQNALQGLEIDQEYIQNRLLKRLVAQSLVPVVRAPDQWSWEACGSNWISYIDNLYSSFEATWQVLLDLGICDESQLYAAQDGVLRSLYAAIERGREQYRNQLYGSQFQRYPAYLEFPPIEADRLPLVA